MTDSFSTHPFAHLTPAKREQLKRRVAWLSVGSNTALVAMKLAVGAALGSVSIKSEAIHSGLDLVAAGIALWAVRAASKPADAEHPYGHGKFENLSGAIEAVLIIIAAVWILYESSHKLLSPAPLSAPGWGAAVMGVSALVNFLVSRKLFRVSKLTESIALEADAWHLRTDVYTSLGVMGGLIGIALGKLLMPALNLHWLDPVVAIVVGLMILKAGISLTLTAARDLLDSRLPDEEQDWIETYLKSRSELRGFHDLRTRRSGGVRFIEVHIELPALMSVRDSHDIAHAVSQSIRERFQSASVLVHVDPAEESAGVAIAAP